MTQEELMALKLPVLQKLADRNGILWANVRGTGCHLRKQEIAAALAQRIADRNAATRRYYRVVKVGGGEIARFATMAYAAIFWRGLVQINEAARQKFRIEEVLE